MRQQAIRGICPRARFLSAAAVLALVGACSPYSVVDIPSVNQSSRVDYVVIHFTSEDYAESIRLLTTRTQNPVSSHYLIPLVGDPTYPRQQAVLHRLVAEERRAWHAGRSYWAGEESLNDRSIGIEIVNLSRCEQADDETRYVSVAESCQFEPFADEQIAVVIRLVGDILKRYPGIDPVDIVGHADIAPSRKFDPGPLFPWEALYDAGIGAWPDASNVARRLVEFNAAMPEVRQIQRALLAYGYALEASGEIDTPTRNALRAFQMHFLPEQVTGSIDPKTAATLFALLEKYRPEELGDVLAPVEPGLNAESTPAPQ